MLFFKIWATIQLIGFILLALWLYALQEEKNIYSYWLGILGYLFSIIPGFLIPMIWCLL